LAANFRERLSVSKRTAQNFYMERFDLRNLNDLEVKEEHRAKISNRFKALENLDGNTDIDAIQFIIFCLISSV
jgi:hypothetical protein